MWGGVIETAGAYLCGGLSSPHLLLPRGLPVVPSLPPCPYCHRGCDNMAISTRSTLRASAHSNEGAGAGGIVSLLPRRHCTDEPPYEQGLVGMGVGLVVVVPFFVHHLLAALVLVLVPVSWSHLLISPFVSSPLPASASSSRLPVFPPRLILPLPPLTPWRNPPSTLQAGACKHGGGCHLIGHRRVHWLLAPIVHPTSSWSQVWCRYWVILALWRGARVRRRCITVLAPTIHPTSLCS